MVRVTNDDGFWPDRDCLSERLEGWALIDCAKKWVGRIQFPDLPVEIGQCYPGKVKTGSSVVMIDPEVMSGTPCFAGTRVPARTLIDNLEAGDSLDVFLEDFPTVTRQQAVTFLDEASERLLAQLV